jgi:hypothetical protein
VSVWTSKDQHYYRSIAIDKTSGSFNSYQPSTDTLRNTKRVQDKTLNNYMKIYNNSLKHEQIKQSLNENAYQNLTSINLIHQIIDDNHQRLEKKNSFVKRKPSRLKDSLNGVGMLEIQSANSLRALISESLNHLVQKYSTA